MSHMVPMYAHYDVDRSLATGTSGKIMAQTFAVFVWLGSLGRILCFTIHDFNTYLVLVLGVYMY